MDDNIYKKTSKKDGGKDGKDSKKKSRLSFFSKSGEKGKQRQSMVNEDAIVRKKGRTPKGKDSLKPPLPSQTQQDKSLSPRKSLLSQQSVDSDGKPKSRQSGGSHGSRVSHEKYTYFRRGPQYNENNSIYGSTLQQDDEADALRENDKIGDKSPKNKQSKSADV